MKAELRILKQSPEQRERQLVLKDVGMFVRGEMFADVSGEVSVGFINITGTTSYTLNYKKLHFTDKES